MGRRLIAVLRLKLGIVDGMGGESRYCAGFHAPHIESLFLEPEGKASGRRISQTAGRKVFQTDMDEAVEEGAGGDYHGPDPYLLVEGCPQTDYAAVFHDQRINDSLADRQILLIFKDGFHPQPVQQAVGLGT